LTYFPVEAIIHRLFGEPLGSERMLRLFWVYLLSMVLFLIPTLTVRIAYRLDSVLWLPKLNSGPANLILAGLLISFGIFWGAWSLHSLLTVGNGHSPEAFLVSLAPATVRLVTTDAFKHTGNPVVFGYLFALAVVGWVWGSIGVSLIIPLIGGILMACYLKVFEERNLDKRFGAERNPYKQVCPC
jgi:hypothetical protein